MTDREVDSTGTDDVRDPEGTGARPQTHADPDAAPRPAEPGTTPLPSDHEEVREADEITADREEE